MKPGIVQMIFNNNITGERQRRPPFSYTSSTALFVASRPAFSNIETWLPPVPVAGPLVIRIALARCTAPRMKGHTGADFDIDTTYKVATRIWWSRSFVNARTAWL
jgi:hypothetical protein